MGRFGERGSWGSELQSQQASLVVPPGYLRVACWPSRTPYVLCWICIFCRGTDLGPFELYAAGGAPKDRVPGMSQAHLFYEGRSFYEGFTWWSVIQWISQGLREHYEVSKELPPELLRLIRKLDDSDWLFPGVRWQKDADLLFG